MVEGSITQAAVGQSAVSVSFDFYLLIFSMVEDMILGIPRRLVSYA